MINILEFVSCTYKYGAYKKSKFILHLIYFLEIFGNHTNMFAIFLRSSYK